MIKQYIYIYWLSSGCLGELELHGLSWTVDFGLPAAVSSHRHTWRVRQDKDHLMWYILNYSKDWGLLVTEFWIVQYIFDYVYIYIYTYVYVSSFACLVFPPPSRSGAMRKRTRTPLELCECEKVLLAVAMRTLWEHIILYNAKSLMLNHAVNHCQFLSNMMSSVTVYHTDLQDTFHLFLRIAALLEQFHVFWVVFFCFFNRIVFSSGVNGII